MVEYAGDDERQESSTSVKALGLLKNRLPRIARERRIVHQENEESNVGSSSSSSVGGNHDGGDRTNAAGDADGNESVGSLNSGSSFPDRNKRKPKFQRMLEKAREEEEISKRERASKPKKPLWQRILEKAQADIDREEKLKMEEYKRAIAQKRTVIPPIGSSPAPGLRHERAHESDGLNHANPHRHHIDSSSSNVSSSSAAAAVEPPSVKLRRQQATHLSSNGRHLGHGSATSENKPFDSHLQPMPLSGRGGSMEGDDAQDARVMQQQQYMKKMMKIVPLYKRMQEKAKLEMEMEEKEKLMKYNLMRKQRSDAHPPSRVEIKERLARYEALQHEMVTKAGAAAAAGGGGGAGDPLIRKRGHGHQGAGHLALSSSDHVIGSVSAGAEGAAEDDHPMGLRGPPGVGRKVGSLPPDMHAPTPEGLAVASTASRRQAEKIGVGAAGGGRAGPGVGMGASAASLEDRPVPYRRTPIDPFAIDETDPAAVFSPLSVGTNSSSVASRDKEKDKNRKKKFGIGLDSRTNAKAPRIPPQREMSVEDRDSGDGGGGGGGGDGSGSRSERSQEDDDVDESSSALAKKAKWSPRPRPSLRNVFEDDDGLAGGGGEPAEGGDVDGAADGLRHVRFGGGDGGGGGERAQPRVGRGQDVTERDRGKEREKSKSPVPSPSQSPSGKYAKNIVKGFNSNSSVSSGGSGSGRAPARARPTGVSITTATAVANSASSSRSLSDAASVLSDASTASVASVGSGNSRSHNSNTSAGPQRTTRSKQTPPTSLSFAESHAKHGPQWLADVLETDASEPGLVMMYAEGFQMYFSEQGLL